MSGINFTGLGSGIDASRIAGALYDQLTVKNQVSSSQITQLENENSSLEKFRELLLGLGASLDGLGSIDGGGAAREVSVADDSVLSAVADSTAVNSSFSITVSSLARGARGSFNADFLDSSDFLISDEAQSGLLTVQVGSGSEAESFELSIDTSTTVDDFITQFNATLDGKASAALVNIGTESSPSYRISFAAAKEGEDLGTLLLSSTNSQLLDSALGGVNLDQASNARFSLSGFSSQIERQSNQINDVVQGVSFSLKSTGTTNVTVQSDISALSAKVEDFVKAYNELVDFANQENAISQVNDGTETSNVYGSLARSSIDDDALTSIRSTISSSRSEDQALSLAQLGITTQRDGTLAFDSEVFEKVAGKDSKKASEVVANLADGLLGTQGVIHQYTGYALGIDGAISANNESISRLQDTIAGVERSAEQREEAVLNQFSRLEGLMARLNSNAQYLSQLLQF